MISSTRIPARAPAVIPSVEIVLNKIPFDVLGAARRDGRACTRSARHFFNFANRRVGRADDKQGIDNRPTPDRLLPVGRRVANVSRAANDIGEPPRQSGDHRARVIDRQGGLVT